MSDYFLSQQPKNLIQLPLYYSSLALQKYPPVSELTPTLSIVIFPFERALSGSELARFLILKIWFVGYLGFLVAATSA